MTTITHRPGGAIETDRTMRYVVAITLIGDNVGEHRALYRHETDGVALARLTSLLNLQPLAHVEEQRTINIDHPILVQYTIFLRPHVWAKICERIT